MTEIHGNKLTKGLSSDFSTLGFYSKKKASLRKYMAQVTSLPEVNKIPHRKIPNT